MGLMLRFEINFLSKFCQLFDKITIFFAFNYEQQTKFIIKLNLKKNDLPKSIIELISDPILSP